MAVSPSRAAASEFASFREFYPYYLRQHSVPGCRRLHVLGTLAGLGCAAVGLGTRHYGWLLAAPLVGYLPAWAGHLLFEHNLPATFRHPLYSLRGDFALLAEVLTGRTRW